MADPVLNGKYIKELDELTSINPEAWLTFQPDTVSDKAFRISLLNFIKGLPETKSYDWTWNEGIDHLGTHLDFTIATATEDGEIKSIDSCILFAGGSVQVNNFTLEDNNFVSDTVRLEGTAGEREATVEVVLFYNRAGIGVDGGGKAAINVFDPSIKADGIVYFEDYEQVGVINLIKDASVANAVAGQKIQVGGIHGIIKSTGANINHTNDFDFIVKDDPIVDEKFALTAVWRGQKFSASLLQVESPSDTSVPTMSSLVVAADNLTAELFFNEATYANDDGTGDLQLTDFGTATLTGGTATAPVLSNPVHSAGDSSITFDLSYTGEADGTEVLEIPVANGASIYDVNGNAMDAGESAVDTMNFLYAFANTHSIVMGSGIQVGNQDIGNDFWIGDAGGDKPFSAEIWFKSDAVIDTNKTIMRGIDLAQTDYSWDVYHNASGVMTFRLRATAANQLIITSNNGLLVAASTWYQTIVTYDGSETIGGLKLRLNSVDWKNAESDIGSYVGFPAQVGNIELKHSLAPQMFNLTRYYNRVLSLAEITSLYNGGEPIALDDPSVDLVDDCILEQGFNNNLLAAIGPDFTIISGTPTYDTEMPS